VQKCLEQFVVVFGLPDICHFVAAKVMQGRPKVPVNRGDQTGYMFICLALPDVQLGRRLFQIWRAYYQIFFPQTPRMLSSELVMKNFG